MAKSKKQTKHYSFGWLPDLPDHRDLLYSAPMLVMRKLPAKVDLRAKCPPVYDQGALGSCTANALGGAFQFGQKKQLIPNFIPSRLFIYYNERVLINTILSDSGAYIRDGIKTMNTEGVCNEKDWPYIIPQFTAKPPAALYKKAATNQVLSYMRLNNASLVQLQSCLAEGFPFVFGFTVFESFQSIGKNGIMPMPKPSEKRLGGHAVMAVGYDDNKKVFLVRNSWSNVWGDQGYFYMPYAYTTDTNRADDFWTIRLVEKGLAIRR
ncbi:MAG: C1 family peptidase [Bacteroidota bacterium]